MAKGNLLVAQGGGPTAVINQSLVGVVLEARKHAEIDRVFGSLHGVEGIVKGELLDLTEVAQEHLESVAATPGSALLSTRVKPDAEYCKKMFEQMKKFGIRYFFYIGGNDSSDTVRIVSEYAESEGYELKAVHVPKTVDNDLVINDHTPGFGSAARYVANAFGGVDFDNRSLGGVYIGVVMGRHAGFLTAAAALGRVDDESGPHLVYLPEVPFDIEKFARDVDAVYKKYKRCVVAVSEGIQDADGTPIVTKLMKDVERDAHGNVQLSGTGALGDLLASEIKARLGIGRVRADTLGYIQRSFLGDVSDTDQKEARAVAEYAVRHAVNVGTSASMVILRDCCGKDACGCGYKVKFEAVGLREVAAKTKHMDPAFIHPDGNQVTDAFVAYAMPLLGSGFVKGQKLQAPVVRSLE